MKKGASIMLQSVPATVDADGTVHLLEAVHLRSIQRAIVTIIGGLGGKDDETPEISATNDTVNRVKNIVRETAGLWSSRQGDGLEYVSNLRSEWDSR